MMSSLCEFVISFSIGSKCMAGRTAVKCTGVNVNSNSSFQKEGVSSDQMSLFHNVVPHPLKNSFEEGTICQYTYFCQGSESPFHQDSLSYPDCSAISHLSHRLQHCDHKKTQHCFVLGKEDSKAVFSSQKYHFEHISWEFSSPKQVPSRSKYVCSFPLATNRHSSELRKMNCHGFYDNSSLNSQ